MTSRAGFTPENFGLGDGQVSDRGRLAGAATPGKNWVRRRAVRTCAHHAVNSGELAQLLDMVGLDPKEGR